MSQLPHFPNCDRGYNTLSLLLFVCTKFNQISGIIHFLLEIVLANNRPLTDFRSIANVNFEIAKINTR